MVSSRTAALAWSLTASGRVGRGRLAGSSGEADGVQQDYGPSLKLDPAALGEVGEGLVHRLARGADELGQLLLGQVVGDLDALLVLAGRLAEAGGQVEQRLGDAAGNIGEDQVGERLIRPAQPP